VNSTKRERGPSLATASAGGAEPPRSPRCLHFSALNCAPSRGTEAKPAGRREGLQNLAIVCAAWAVSSWEKLTVRIELISYSLPRVASEIGNAALARRRKPSHRSISRSAYLRPWLPLRRARLAATSRISRPSEVRFITICWAMPIRLPTDQ